MNPVVSALSLTPVKGTRLRSVPEITLGRDGAPDNRRYYVIDDRGRMVNGKQFGELQTVVAESMDGTLSLTFPDGSVVAGEVSLGEPLSTQFFSRPRAARPLDGPWSQALSDYLGRGVRLVDGGHAVDRGVAGAVSLISRASLDRLAQEAGESGVDARRFRMLIEVDGIGAHDEDRWVGCSVRIGEAEVGFNGNVGRCLVTSRDPESGEVTLPTLDILGGYRRDSETTEPLPFGIYGQVLSSGTVRVGDPLSLLH